MKRLLLPLLAALALPTAVNAEIWIDVANYYEGLEKERYFKIRSFKLLKL